MGDISEQMPQIPETVRLIYETHEKKARTETPRGYLGGSVLGHECDRFLWYTFRGCVPRGVDARPGDHPGRMHRLFQTGHLEEDRLVAELRAIGCEVVQFDESRGLTKDGKPKQILVSMLGGHLRGHLDGAVLGVPEAPKTWHVLECKTHNLKSFAKLKKDGVQQAKPEHWCQMQVYMAGTSIKRALYLAVCKDTDELYAERIRYDAQAAQNLLDRGARIIRTSQPPERIAEREDDWRCRFCKVKPLCWGLDDTRAVALPGKTCRTCCHATPVTDEPGGWRCEKFGADLEDTLVGADCPAHLLLPGLVHFAVPSDADDDGITFKSRDGTHWRHTSLDGDGWSTEELIGSRGPLDGPKVDAEPSLLDAYPWQESERVWDGPVSDLTAFLRDTLGESFFGLTPTSTFDDEDVNAAEYRIGEDDYLVVAYKADEHAGVWKGKS